MADKTYISKVKLPSGKDYYIKDAEARKLIDNLGSPTHFVGVTTSELTNGATTNPVVINNENYTAKAGDIVVHDNAEFIFDGTKWVEFGDLSKLGDLAKKNNVTLNKGTGDTVLGKNTTFSTASSSVTFTGRATDKVLGSDATFTTTVNPTIANIKATASGGSTAWNSKDSKTVLTGVKVTAQPTISLNAVEDGVVEEGSGVIRVLTGGSITRSTSVAVGASGSDTFVKSYPGTTQKLVTTTVPNVTGNENVSIPNVTSVGTASTFSFVMGTGTDDKETLIISGSNSTTPTLGTALSASKVTLGADKTVATGSLNSSGGGASVMTGLGTPTTASAVTDVEVTTQPVFTFSGQPAAVSATASGTTVGANGTASVIGANSTFTNTQPTVALATGATAGTGVISVATGITSASTTTNDKDEVTAITNVGTGTAAAQTITVDTNDEVKVAKFDDLSVTVS